MVVAGACNGSPLGIINTNKREIIELPSATPVPTLPEYWGLSNERDSGDYYDDDSDDDGPPIQMGRMNADCHIVKGRGRPEIQRHQARAEARFLAAQWKCGGLVDSDDEDDDDDDASTGVASEFGRSPNGLSTAEANVGPLLGDLHDIAEDAEVDAEAVEVVEGSHRSPVVLEQSPTHSPTCQLSFRRPKRGCTIL
mmetsp:Transcript_15097/g.34353  ORF Transcript_15097/g.34353 Transcript_15097/m.34353 type:complete len:196 (+) Transcript_15097:33-620(+)